MFESRNNENGRRADPFRRLGSVPEPAGAPMSSGAVLLCAVAALCITALVLMASARSESAMRLSQAAIDASQGYYQACYDANSDLANLRSGASFPCSLDRTYAISGTQELRVRAEIDGPDDYTILEWRSVPSGAWAPDQTLDVAK